jgi:hypothetical protein
MALVGEGTDAQAGGDDRAAQDCCNAIHHDALLNKCRRDMRTVLVSMNTRRCRAAGAPGSGGGRTGDATAFLGTAPAGLSTTLAVLVLVLGALGAARVADVRAQPADGGHEAGAAAHVGCAAPADFGAVDAELGALRHIADAGVAATLALLCAIHAGVETRLMFLVGHLEAPYASTVEFAATTGRHARRHARMDRF